VTLSLTPGELVRFRSRIQQGPGCWEWTGERNNKGYGRFRIYRNGKCIRLLAHRLVLTLKLGREPASGTRHRCDNPPCCRPDHLLEGSQRDNLQDARARGRANYAGLVAYRQARDQRVLARIAAGIKTCNECHLVKPFAAFARAHRAADGRTGKCKDCRNARVIALRAERRAS
jgi:hypothetical protein